MNVKENESEGKWEIVSKCDDDKNGNENESENVKEKLLE